MYGITLLQVTGAHVGRTAELREEWEMNITAFQTRGKPDAASKEISKTGKGEKKKGRRDDDD